MRTLRESGLLAIYDGVTTIEEVVAQTIVEEVAIDAAAGLSKASAPAARRPPRQTDGDRHGQRSSTKR